MVSRDHEDGSPLAKDELIKIGYEAEHQKKMEARIHIAQMQIQITFT